MSVNNDSSSSSLYSKRDRLADGLPGDSSRLGHADNFLDLARAEVKERKAAKKDRKTFCGHCGKHKDEGMKLQTCSLCRSINYCNATCQRDHWKSGHKTDCASFKQPPLAKNFDPSDRADVPWPHDPIFAQGNKDGLGIWLTTAGSLSSSLQQAFEPVDNQECKLDPMGPPSFQRWAKVGPHSGRGAGEFGPETKNFLGPSLLSLRVLVQNRRKDDKVVLVNAAQMVITVVGMEDVLLPDEKKSAIFGKSRNGIECMSVPPWTDYNGQCRAAILEINGVEAPKGKFGADGDGEYEMPSPPTGDPWGRVLQWDMPRFLLAPGDFAICRMQYRLGDGDVCQDYPEIMTRFAHCALQCRVLQPKSKTPGDFPGEFAWINEARILFTRLPNPESITLIGHSDFDYLQEYYRPYFDEGEDVWAEKRLGGRAKMVNDMMNSMTPPLLKATMSSMTPENRAEVVRRFQVMGVDIERALGES